MASNKKFRFGPVAVPNPVANILNPPTASGGVNGGASAQYIILNHLRIVNKTAGAVNVSLFIGATGASAAGTEFAFTTTPVPANTGAGNYVDWYGAVRLDAADFLTALASAGTSLVISGEGEIGGGMMTGTQALDLIMSRLGNLTDTTMRASVLLELQVMQRQLERGRFLPWFLLTDDTSTYSTAANVESVALGASFLRFDTEIGGVWYKDTTITTADQWVELARDDYNTLKAKYAQGVAGSPSFYDLIDRALYFRAIPDVVYPLRVWAYTSEAQLADDGNTNQWLTYADQWLCSATGALCAGILLQNPDLAASLSSVASQARDAMQLETTSRFEALKNRQMGDD